MSLKTRFESKCDTVIGDGRHTIVVRDRDIELSCELSDVHGLASPVSHLSLVTDRLAHATPDDLKKIGQFLATRLTYLLEPVGPIESDAELGVMQLRSTPPHQDGDTLSYYEILVSRGGELTLSRYELQAGQDRQAVPAVLTREALLRLVEDLADAVT